MHIRDTWKLMRPRHWVKNVFVFAALVFAGRLGEARSALAAFGAFAAFCLLSSAAYAFNDVADAAEDRRHPRKKERPVAAGRLSARAALGVSVVCFLAGEAICLLVTPALALVGAAYVALMLLYTLALKRWPVADVACIALGFVLRAVAGGVAVGVEVSNWLLACTFALCLFLGFAKRRGELAELGEGSAAHRPALAGYSAAALDWLLAASGALAVAAFGWYTVTPATLARIGGPYLLLSVPAAAYGIARVAVLVRRGEAGEPTDIVTGDGPFLAVLVLWCLYAASLATFAPEAGRMLP